MAFVERRVRLSFPGPREIGVGEKIFPKIKPDTRQQTVTNPDTIANRNHAYVSRSAGHFDACAVVRVRVVETDHINPSVLQVDGELGVLLVPCGLGQWFSAAVGEEQDFELRVRHLVSIEERPVNAAVGIIVTHPEAVDFHGRGSGCRSQF